MLTPFFSVLKKKKILVQNDGREIKVGVGSGIKWHL